MDIVESFSRVKVLVIGDVMLDRYWWGSVTRISPEAPVPIVNLQKTTQSVGGAANVAANIAGLGAAVHLVGAVGDDKEGLDLRVMLSEVDISPEFLVTTGGRPTTIKTRVMAHNQQVVRVDHEDITNVTIEVENAAFKKVEDCLASADIVVISDYGKGLLTAKLTKRVISACNKAKKVVLADPKGNDFSKYRDVNVLTPNRLEAQTALRVSPPADRSLDSIGDELMSRLSLSALLITLGEDGMRLFQKGAPPIDMPAIARHVYDVTGAGDTVIATLAVGLGSGLSMTAAAELANKAAGFVVEELGTTRIDISRLLENHPDR